MGNDRKNKNNTKRQGWKKVNHHKYQPRRGGPGILMACETGREIKCEREGLEILNHYYYNNNNDGSKTSNHDSSLDHDTPIVATLDNSHNNNDDDDDAKELSVEEEILLLQSGASVEQVLGDNKRITTTQNGKKRNKKGNKNFFSPYETGCRGSVFVMCTIPNNDLLLTTNPPLNDNNNDDDDAKVTSSTSGHKNETCHSMNTDLLNTTTNKDESDAEAPLAKRRKFSTTKTITTKRDEIVTKEKEVWDPIDTVRRIIHDLKQNNPTVPRSRFVTRMIPMQATCFASLDEIQITSKRLLQKYLISSNHLTPQHKTETTTSSNSSTATFKIDFRRRNCSNVTRTQVIDAVAKIMEELTSSNPNQFSVNLTNPDYTIQIEICKTLCGMSVIKNIHSFHNFNLIEIQEKLKSKDAPINENDPS